MESSDNGRDRSVDRFLRSFRTYVLSPLTAAPRIVEREQRELEAEIEAYQAFLGRVEAIDIPTMGATASREPVVLKSHSETDTAAEFCRAFRETVMAVSHYEEVYGEPLREHVTAEFGADFADTLCMGEQGRLPPQFKDALVVATAQSVRVRQEFLDTLNREAESIKQANDELTDLVTEFAETTVPEWYKERFQTQLDELTQKRQATIQNYPSTPYYDGHTLCEYLYSDETPTYPVLAAVARLREVTS